MKTRNVPTPEGRIMDAEGTLAPDARHLARGTDPQTSHAAATRAVDLAGKHGVIILAWLRANPAGGTKDEIARGTGLDAIAVARRMNALCKHFGVYESGETRATPAGRQAIVWRVRT